MEKRNSTIYSKIRKAKERTAQQNVKSREGQILIENNKEEKEGRGLADNINFLQSSVETIELKKIMSNPYQPRKTFNKIEELAESILQNGLLQPIAVVRRNGDYIIIAGERRYRAYLLLSKSENKNASLFTSIKANIFEDITNQNLKELAIIENVQREGMSMFEMADALATLQEDGYSIRDIEKATGTKKSTVQKYLKISLLSPHIRMFAGEDDIHVGVAFLLAKTEELSEEQIISLLKKPNCRNNAQKMEFEIDKILNPKGKNNQTEKSDLFSLATSPMKKRIYQSLTGESRKQADELLKVIISAKKELDLLSEK